MIPLEPYKVQTSLVCFWAERPKGWFLAHTLVFIQACDHFIQSRWSRALAVITEWRMVVLPRLSRQIILIMETLFVFLTLPPSDMFSFSKQIWVVSPLWILSTFSVFPLLFSQKLSDCPLKSSAPLRDKLNDRSLIKKIKISLILGYPNSYFYNKRCNMLF